MEKEIVLWRTEQVGRSGEEIIEKKVISYGTGFLERYRHKVQKINQHYSEKQNWKRFPDPETKKL